MLRWTALEKPQGLLFHVPYHRVMEHRPHVDLDDMTHISVAASPVGEERPLRAYGCVLDTFFRLGWSWAHNTIHSGQVH